jgi:opacity protein-like surface antigen
MLCCSIILLQPRWSSAAAAATSAAAAAAVLQEVVTGDKPRFSISGWYHKSAPQQGSEHASLQQLQMKAGEDQIQQHTEFEGERWCKKWLVLSGCAFTLWIMW